MSRIIAFLSILFGAVSSGLADGPSEIRKAIAEGALVLDVRTSGEYAQGHYTGAKNIPYDELRARYRELGEPNRIIVVYCRTGRRSAIAREILTSLGFTRVIDAKTMQQLGGQDSAL